MSLIEKKWRCDQCYDLHDSEDGAIDCCPPTATEVFCCPTCGHGHHDEDGAIHCCEENAELLADEFGDPGDSRVYPKGDLPASEYIAKFNEANHYKGAEHGAA